MKRLYFLLVLAALVRPGFSQDIVVPLERKQARTPEFQGRISEVPTRIVKNPEGFKGIPSGLWEHVIKSISFQSTQQFFEQYTQGVLSKDQFLDLVKRYKMDTLKLSRKPTQHEVSLLIGTNTAGKRLVIVDANANHDFSDDQSIEFDPSITDKKEILEVLARTPISEAHYEYFDGERVQKRTAAFRTKIYNQNYSFRDSLETKWFVSIQSIYNRVGQIKVDNKARQILLDTQIDDGLETRKPSFNFINVDGFIDEIRYSLSDTLLFGHNEYRFERVEPGNTAVFLKYLRHVERPVGFSENQHAFAIAQTDLDGQSFSLEALRGKYVLLDFWGTWCGPCVKMIPELKALNERFKDKNLVLVSVAYEEKPEPVQKMALAKGMNWTHLFVTSSNSPKGNPVDRFRINCFPTTILIDPEGKIVVRGCGEKDFQRAVAILEQNR